MRALLVGALITVIAAGPAVALPGDGDDTSTNVAPHGNGFGMGALSTQDGVYDQDTPLGHGSPAGDAPANDLGPPACVVDQAGDDCSPVVICRPEEASPLGGILLLLEPGWMTQLGWCDPSAPAAPTITPAMVLRAFKRIPLPASRIVVQPPDGRTLVNFETNFYTEADAFERTVTLLGQKITLNISPVSYIWRYGDETSDTTSSPGAPYPALLVTHEYEKADDVRVSVDTVWSADYRVNGGEWSPVNGTVIIDGASEPLEIVEATPLLTGTYQ